MLFATVFTPSRSLLLLSCSQSVSGVVAYRYGELAVARAIGSAHIKRDPSKRALIPTPEVHSVQLQQEDDFVVLATDGLWDKVRTGQQLTQDSRLCM
jgi:serine/threonine protein phosphatase PrpC